MCSKAMNMKCRDCIVANYFSNDCCLPAHKQSPFHWISHWTGTHFAPISLYLLIFQLCLRHDGDPCPLTVEVLWIEFLQLIYWLTWSKGIKAADNHQCPKQTSRQTCSSSLQPVKEEHIPSVGLPLDPQATTPSDGLEDVNELCEMFKEANTLLDDREQRSCRVCTANLGNPLLTIVNTSSIFEMEVLFCICQNAGDKDEQLLMAQHFPSSLKQIETVFTVLVLNDFLMDNLECKTTAQQYYSKLQSITNQMSSDLVSVCHLLSEWHMACLDSHIVEPL